MSEGAVESMQAGASLPPCVRPELDIADLDKRIAHLTAELETLTRLREKFVHPPRQALSRAGSEHLEAIPAGLFPWQAEALEAWRGSGRRGVVQAVTGAGKTRVGLAAIAEARAEDRRAVVIVPTKELVRQWCAVVAAAMPTERVASTVQRTGWTVLVSTVHAVANTNPLGVGERALLVADECHRYGAPAWGRALRPQFDQRLGLSATFERGDSGDDDVLKPYFKGLCFDLGYARAKADGLIAPFRFAFAGVPFAAAERNEYRQLTETLRDLTSVLVRRFGVMTDPYADFLKQVQLMALDEGHRGRGLARFFLKTFTRRRELLSETRMKHIALAGVVDVVRSSGGTLVFTQTRESAEQAATILEEQGCSSAAVFADLSDSERQGRLDDFAEQSIVALAAPRILDEGVDVPDADLGIVLAANRSRRQMIQRLGRVLRRKPDGRAARFVVLYVTDTVEDPMAGGGTLDFYDELLPHGEETAHFELEQDGALQQLVAFLGGAEAGASAEKSFRALQRKAAAEAADGAEEQKSSHPTGDSPERKTHRGEGKPRRRKARHDSPFEGDGIQDYLQRAATTPLLTAAEETELARRIEAGLLAEERLDAATAADSRRFRRDLWSLRAEGIQAKDHFVRANLRLVVSIAKHYLGQGLEFLDLIQEGNIGLNRAVEKFDHRLGHKFSTYATWWIKQSITRAIADQSRTIRVPVYVHEKVKIVDRARRDAGLAWGELLEAGPAALGAAGDAVDDDALRLAWHASIAPLSVDEITDDHDLDIVDEVDLVDELELQVARAATVDLILESVEDVDHRAADILRRRCGFDGEPQTLDDIGKAYGVTRERIRQIEAKALKRVRESYGIRDGAEGRGAGIALESSRDEALLLM